MEPETFRLLPQCLYQLRYVALFPVDGYRKPNVFPPLNNCCFSYVRSISPGNFSSSSWQFTHFQSLSYMSVNYKCCILRHWSVYITIHLSISCCTDVILFPLCLIAVDSITFFVGVEIWILNSFVLFSAICLVLPVYEQWRTEYYFICFLFS
jgi:hypothetical protein